MSRTVRGRAARTWQCRGRCAACRRKIAGSRRVRRCACGGAVRYWQVG